MRFGRNRKESKIGLKTCSFNGPSVPFTHAVSHRIDGNDTQLDLDAAPLIVEGLPHVRARIRKDLNSICDAVLGVIPGASVLLTGSLSVGEGRCREGPVPTLLESDYDLVVVTRSFTDAMPAVTGKKLKPMFAKMRFFAPLEITLIWKPMLAMGMTTTAGRIIRGNRCLVNMLENLSAPRAAGALAGAYCDLAALPISPVGSASLLSKAVVNAARAFLLQRYSTAPRSEWLGLSSIRVIQGRVEECEGFFEADEIALLHHAGDHLLRKKPFTWAQEHYFIAKTLLNRVRRVMARPLSRRQVIKHAAWTVKHRGIVRGLISGGADPVRALQRLVEAWGVAEAPGRRRLMDAVGEVRKFSVGFPAMNENGSEMLYGELFDIMQRYVSFFPNKLHFPECHGWASG